LSCPARSTMALKVGGITRAMVRASGEPATWYRVRIFMRHLNYVIYA
jgi:hypothetical protein